MLGGRAIKAVIPGGVSMPVLRGDQIDVAMDHESLRAAGTLIGTGGAIVMDDRTCMVRTALVVARFFEHESCGQCTQCREGTGWTYKTLRRIESGEGVPQDLRPWRTLRIHGRQMYLRACGRRAWAARAFLKQFRADFEAHIAEHQCPFPESFEDERKCERSPASQRDRRDLGTPDRTEGSLDDPREREEEGVRFNEKWIYTHLHRDPAGATMRTVYWMRYDFRGTAVRNSVSEPWRPDTALVEAAAKRDGRLPRSILRAIRRLNRDPRTARFPI